MTAPSDISFTTTPSAISARATLMRGSGCDSATSNSAPSDLEELDGLRDLAEAHFISGVSSVSKSRYSAPVGWKRSSTPSTTFCTETGVVRRCPGFKKLRANSCSHGTACSASTPTRGLRKSSGPSSLRNSSSQSVTPLPLDLSAPIEKEQLYACCRCIVCSSASVADAIEISPPRPSPGHSSHCCTPSPLSLPMRSTEYDGTPRLARRITSCSAPRCLSRAPIMFCRLKGSLSVRSTP
mmetsp:Transcript_20230/g.48549  ORF Transcript_20230/g.48549 Transcript_20230/m.48549 type:complete len:239 (-) Transcript_20230:784-1500(-)